MSSWLIGVVAAAMLVAVARSLMPAGAVQQVGSLVCAVMLLWAVLKPLAPLAQSLLGEFHFVGQTQGMEVEWSQQNEQLLKSFIEQECRTYIVDKAEELGIACQAHVTCRLGEEGVWLPDYVCVSGDLTTQQRHALEQVISGDLGVMGEQQEYLGGG